MVMKITIIYEDENIVAVDKPSGLLVHPTSNSKEETLTNWVLEQYPETENVGEPLKLNNGEVIKRPGIVHRIDRETSGIILIAKTNEAFEHLKKQFQSREIEKIYRTFVWGNFPSTMLGTGKLGVIDKPIGRSASDFRKKSAERGSKGLEREAVTNYKVLNQNDKHSYLECYPKTGRTHQIRVHLKSIGRPIICDTLYAPKLTPALGFERLALHALSVTFKNVIGDTITAEAQLPEDFVMAEGELQNVE